MKSMLSLLGPFRARAAALLASPQAVTRIARGAVNFLDGRASLTASLESVREDVATCASLVRAWLDGDYRGIATSSAITIVAALLYLVTPTDAIPDIIPVGGYVDDAALLGLVAAQLESELTAFRQWQAGGHATGGVALSDPS